MRNLKCLILIVLTCVFTLGTQVQAQGAINSVDYGIFDSANSEGGWVVIGDQAMVPNPGCVIRNSGGLILADASDITVGSPVRYEYYISNRVWYVDSITIIETLPSPEDEEEG